MNRLSKTCCLTPLFACLLALSANADEGQVKAKVGHKAPNFVLKDTHGDEHSLEQYTKEGKVVVLEWFNHECPVCAGHAGEKTMVNLVKKYQDQNVVLLGIDSTNWHAGEEAKINKQLQIWGTNYPILMDPDGKVGRMFHAKTTPHMFIIDKEGTLVYDGAVDDKKDTNYITQALDQVLAGETVAVSKTKPYGCSVKYKKKKKG